MQRIELDFIRRAPRSRWAGRVLLACALGLAGDLAFRTVRLAHTLSENQAVVARAQPKRPASAPASADEVALARDTVERLALPWSKLFAALEAAASDQVALLAVEPDAKAGKVLISGEGKDYLAALTYVLNLSRSAALSGVQLVRHEMKPEDPQRPVSFAVSATWREDAR